MYGPLNLDALPGDFHTLQSSYRVGLSGLGWGRGRAEIGFSNGFSKAESASPNYLASLFTPGSSPTISVVVPERSFDFGYAYSQRGWVAKAALIRTWEPVQGQIDRIDGDNSNPIYIGWVPLLRKYSLSKSSKRNSFEIEAITGNGGSFFDLPIGGAAFVEGRVESYRVSTRTGRRSAYFLRDLTTGGSRGVVSSGASLGLGFPKSSVVQYRTAYGASRYSLGFTLPIRDKDLSVAHHWIAASGEGSYSANALFVSSSGSGSITIPKTRLLEIAVSSRPKGAWQPAWTLRQFVPYDSSSTSSGSGSGGSGTSRKKGSPLGGTVLEVVWSGVHF